MSVDLPTLIQVALQELGDHATRRERVFAVAEIIHRNTGSSPTVAETRSHVLKGSYTDIGHDLKDFRKTVATQKERVINAPGMPDDLGLQVNDLVTKLWVAATDKAAQDFGAAQSEFNERENELTRKVGNLEAERLQSLEDRSAAMEQLAAELKTVSSLKDAVRTYESTVSDLNAMVERQNTEHASQLQTLQSSLIAANRLIDAKDVAVIQLREQLDECKNQLANEKGLAEAFRLKQLEVQKRLENELSVLQSDLASVKAVASNQKIDLDQRITALETIREASIGAQAVLNAHLETERAGRQSLEQENQTLKTDIKEKSDLIETLHKRIEGLEAKAYKEKR